MEENSDKQHLEYAKAMIAEYQSACFEALFIATQLELFLRNMYEPFKSEEEYKETFGAIFQQLMQQLHLTNKTIIQVINHLYGQVHAERIPIMYAHVNRMTKPAVKDEVKG